MGRSGRTSSPDVRSSSKARRREEVDTRGAFDGNLPFDVMEDFILLFLLVIVIEQVKPGRDDQESDRAELKAE